MYTSYLCISMSPPGPPRFTVPPSDIDLIPGSTATLSCVSSGQPEPWSTWFKTNTSGARIELPTLGSTFTKLSTRLELHDVNRDDSGVYECVVDNGIGTAEQSATVRVEGKLRTHLDYVNTSGYTTLAVLYVQVQITVMFLRCSSCVRNNAYSSQ